MYHNTLSESEKNAIALIHIDADNNTCIYGKEPVGKTYMAGKAPDVIVQNDITPFGRMHITKDRHSRLFS